MVLGAAYLLAERPRQAYPPADCRAMSPNDCLLEPVIRLPQCLEFHQNFQQPACKGFELVTSSEKQTGMLILGFP